MGYLIKLIQENCYLIPDGEGDIITTKSKDEAIKLSVIDDYESAVLTAHSFSGGMTLGEDFELEEV